MIEPPSAYDVKAHRDPPHSIELEQALLGAILNENNAYAAVSAFLRPHHFFDDVHRCIFETLGKVIARGDPATPVTLQVYFSEQDPISLGITIPQYLGSLAANVASTQNAQTYGREIRRLYDHRALALLGEWTVEQAHSVSIDRPPLAIVEGVRQQLDEIAKLGSSGVSAITLDALLAADLPPRDFILSGLLQDKGLAMIFAPRGLGKTWFALGLGYAIASGGTFLKWKAEKPRTIAHICGEMPAVALKERLLSIVAGAGTELPGPDNFRIVSADLHDRGLPDLSTPQGQAQIEEAIVGADVIILDNVSTLFHSGVENESESWSPVQRWLLRLRQQGRTVILIHHAGKHGLQRGTSRREDVLDLVLKLAPAYDADPAQGACFEIRFEKNRGLMGSDVEPFEARLDCKNNIAVWSISSVEGTRAEQIMELKTAGLSIRKIAETVGLSKSAVQRVLASS